eukprot:6197657-Pleurochrysis_carterae.AAC.8
MSLPRLWPSWEPVLEARAGNCDLSAPRGVPEQRAARAQIAVHDRGRAPCGRSVKLDLVEGEVAVLEADVEDLQPAHAHPLHDA